MAKPDNRRKVPTKSTNDKTPRYMQNKSEMTGGQKPKNNAPAKHLKR